LKINKDYPDAITDTANEIEHDINRLSTIASRFAKIGSEPILAPINISKKIDEVIEYYEIRLPHYAGKVKINKNYSDQIIINANDTLIGWVFENIIKNAVEALEGKKGTITISVNTESNKRISVLVSDTGKGMTTKMKLHIFEPGFTTKARG
jgi:signal transduction histidine kinase